MKKFYSLIVCAIMAMASMTASADWYLLGSDNGWSTSNDWKFTDNGDGTFVLLNKTITGKFKISDGTWADNATFGGGGAISIGSTYQLYNPGGDIAVGGALTCSKITFNPTAKTLYLEGEQAKFEITSDIYIRGAISGSDWPAVDAWKFTKESEYVYTLTDKTLSGEFKIADADWGAINYGSNGGNPVIGVPYSLVSGGGNIYIDETYCSKITVTFDESGNATLLLSGEVPGLYIVGDMTKNAAGDGWQFVDDYKLTHDGNGVYSISDIELAGPFKIASPDWATYNFGGQSDNQVIELGQTTTLLNSGDSKNLLTSGTYVCTKITVDTTVPSVMIEGSIKAEDPDTPYEALYIIGDFNNWDYANPDGRLLPTGKADTFGATGLVITAAAGAEFSNWLLYTGLGQIGVYGNESDATESTLEGSLKAGEEGWAGIAPGVYDVEVYLPKLAETATYKFTKTAEVYTWRFYFDNTLSNWENVYAYVWTDEADYYPLGMWPGTWMWAGADGLREVSFVTTKELSSPKVIFSNGTDAQSPDLDLVNGAKYNVEKMIEDDVTGLETIETATASRYVVYNLQGVKVMDVEDASAINTLPAGLYIINGHKVALRK